MDILQPYQRNIPEEKGEKRENQTGQDQQSDEDSFFGCRVQSVSPKQFGVISSEFGVKEFNSPNSKLRTPNLLFNEKLYL
jgi:hypothetical protein